MFEINWERAYRHQGLA